MRKAGLDLSHKKRKKKRREASEEIEDGDKGGLGDIQLVPRPRAHYGSFYLRLGAVVFGIGSMIYSGIEIGMFFELNLDEETDCKNLFSVLRPVLQMTFVFVQMYFIFLNQKVSYVQQPRAFLITKSYH